jgi:hypothetical protein
VSRTYKKQTTVWFLFVLVLGQAVFGRSTRNETWVVGSVYIDGQEYAYAVVGGFSDDSPGSVLQTAISGVAFVDGVYSTKGTIQERDESARAAFAQSEPFFNGKSAIILLAEKKEGDIPIRTLDAFNNRGKVIASIGVSFASSEGLPLYNRLKHAVPELRRKVPVDDGVVRTELKKFATAPGIKIQVVPVLAGLLEQHVFGAGMANSLAGAGMIDDFIYVEAPSGKTNGVDGPAKRFVQPRRYAGLGFESIAALDRDTAFHDGRGVEVMRIQARRFRQLAPTPESWSRMERTWSQTPRVTSLQLSLYCESGFRSLSSSLD